MELEVCYGGKSPFEEGDQLEIWCGEGGLVLKKWEGAIRSGVMEGDNERSCYSKGTQ